MYALVTGGTSGIGYDIAKILSNKGYNIIIVGKDIKKVDKKNFKTNIQLISLDLSKEENCYKLYEKVKKYDIDIFINNAGFGMFGNFLKTDLNTEINMINTNVISVHILTKLFLNDFSIL